MENLSITMETDFMEYYVCDSTRFEKNSIQNKIFVWTLLKSLMVCKSAHNIFYYTVMHKTEFYMDILLWILRETLMSTCKLFNDRFHKTKVMHECELNTFIMLAIVNLTIVMYEFKSVTYVTITIVMYEFKSIIYVTILLQTKFI